MWGRGPALYKQNYKIVSDIFFLTFVFNKYTVTRLDVIFCYPDWVLLTHFVHRAKKVLGMWA